jgi:signal transduction histidine kinase
MNKPGLLVVDDEVDNVDSLERLFRKEYQVYKATSGPEALQILKTHTVPVIVSDQRMPKMTGVEFLEQSIEIQPESIRILLTGYTDIESVIDAINSGQIYRYLTKPWDPVDLKNTIDKAREKYELRATLRERNQQLQEALEELKTLDQAKNQFMVLINHELKTPLTVMTSFLDLLKETNLNKEQQKYCSRVESSTQKLQSLVNEVLELVSADTGLMPLKKSKVKLLELIKKQLHNYEDTAGQRDIKFLINIPDVKIIADSDILNKALRPLIDNAVKFRTKGTEILITAELDENHLNLAITNKGKPLTKKLIDRIMQPFALDEDIMNHTQGLGLGLSMSRALLKHHGTPLNVSSSKGVITASFALERA